MSIRAIALSPARRLVTEGVSALGGVDGFSACFRRFQRVSSKGDTRFAFPVRKCLRTYPVLDRYVLTDRFAVSLNPCGGPIMHRQSVNKRRSRNGFVGRAAKTAKLNTTHPLRGGIRL